MEIKMKIKLVLIENVNLDFALGIFPIFTLFVSTLFLNLLNIQFV